MEIGMSDNIFCARHLDVPVTIALCQIVYAHVDFDLGGAEEAQFGRFFEQTMTSSDHPSFVD